MSAESYFKEASKILEQVVLTQMGKIKEASQVLANAAANGQSIFSFGASHSFILTEEIVYRAGGLMLINPIYPHGMNLFIRPLTLTSQLERTAGIGTVLLQSSPARSGDVLIIASVSGRNPVVVDMALAAAEKKIRTIGITSSAYNAVVKSRHPSGKKLNDVCDIVIDNGAPCGDAIVEIPGFPQKTGPVSSFTGIAIVNAMVSETVALLAKRGIRPPVFMSTNVDGGDDYNARHLKENKDRIHYLD